MPPSMADVVKSAKSGHVVDILSQDGKPDLTYDQSEEIKISITKALFSEEEENISKLKFDDPTFDGIRLRLVCSNDVTRDWLLSKIPELEGLSEGISIEAKVIGPPPKLFRSTMVMPAKTYDPPTLFSIIRVQNSIDTKFWKYLSRTKIANGQQTWFIGVDENSIAALKDIGFRPHVGIGRIKISVSNQTAQ